MENIFDLRRYIRVYLFLKYIFCVDIRVGVVRIERFYFNVLSINYYRLYKSPHFTFHCQE